MNESDNILCDNFGILVYELVLWPAWTRQSHTCLTQHFSKIQVIVESLNEKQKEISQRIMILIRSRRELQWEYACHKKTPHIQRD
jgi:hypothetical protein